MKPYYQDDFATIYHGDCREILPTLGRFDLCLTDPPYELSDAPPGDSHYGMSLSKFEGAAYTSIVCGFEHDEVFPLLANRMDRVNLFCFCSNKQISKLMQWGEVQGFSTTLLVWNKPNSAPFANGVWRGDAEFCIHIRQHGAYFEGNAEDKRKVVSYPCVRDDSHPTVKPIRLVAKYIQIGSPIGAEVLDPFMGSGTTLVAAKQLGRRAVGIEIEERYCEIAAKRLSQEYLPLSTPPEPQTIQSDLIP